MDAPWGMPGQTREASPRGYFPPSGYVVQRYLIRECGWCNKPAPKGEPGWPTKPTEFGPIPACNQCITGDIAPWYNSVAYIEQLGEIVAG